MNNIGLDDEKKILRTGARIYIDVEDAMTEFRRLIQDQCKIVVSRRLNEVSKACDLNWTVNNIKDYMQKATDGFYIGKQMSVKRFGGLYFCLRLSRKEDDRKQFSTFVLLYRQNKNLAVDLWDLLSDDDAGTSYNRTHTLIFERRISEDNILDFQNYLN